MGRSITDCGGRGGLQLTQTRALQPDDGEARKDEAAEEERESKTAAPCRQVVVAICASPSQCFEEWQRSHDCLQGPGLGRAAATYSPRSEPDLTQELPAHGMMCKWVFRFMNSVPHFRVTFSPNFLGAAVLFRGTSAGLLETWTAGA